MIYEPHLCFYLIYGKPHKYITKTKCFFRMTTEKKTQKRSRSLNLICCSDVKNTLKINRTAFIYTYRSRIQCDGFSLPIPRLLSVSWLVCVLSLFANLPCLGRGFYVILKTASQREICSLSLSVMISLHPTKGVLLFSFIRIVLSKMALIYESSVRPP